MGEEHVAVIAADHATAEGAAVAAHFTDRHDDARLGADAVGHCRQVAAGDQRVEFGGLGVGLREGGVAERKNGYPRQSGNPEMLQCSLPSSF
ncbi:hypothetical protein D3C86_1870220 [compost metagenome]